MADQGFNIKTNSIQFMAEASGLIGEDGTIKTNLALDSPGINMKLPTPLFPWLKPNIGLLVTLTVVQIQPEEPKIEVPSSKLILPN